MRLRVTYDVLLDVSDAWDPHDAAVLYGGVIMGAVDEVRSCIPKLVRRSTAPVCAGIRLAQLVKTRDASPAQWDGRCETGELVFIRFRFNCLSVSLDGALVMSLGDIDDNLLADYLTTERMLELTGFIAPEGMDFSR